MKRGESLHDETAPLDRCRRFGRCAPPGRARLRPGGRASTGRMNIRQLAKLCGVSRTTVSHALRDDRAVAESTRERVRRLAAEHDYHPDPDVALQMRRIASKGRSAHASTIAMISPWPEQRAWRNNWILEQFHDGIIDRSEELGYRVDEFWVRAPGMSLSRLNLILSYRGIRGAVVLNHPEIAGVAPFDFQGIAAVVLGRALVQPDLPAVDHDHFGGLNLALRELAGRGYRKIGLALFDDFQERERTDRQWEAAFLLQQQTVPPRRRVPIFVGRKAAPAAVGRRISPDDVGRRMLARRTERSRGGPPSDADSHVTPQLSPAEEFAMHRRRSEAVPLRRKNQSGPTDPAGATHRTMPRPATQGLITDD